LLNKRPVLVAFFYQNGGGVTLTGGEPTFQKEFARTILMLAKINHLNTAMETSGFVQWSVFEELLPYLDEILFDVKHVDTIIHKKYTGEDNALILKNLSNLEKENISLRLRIPLIPDFNASEKDQKQIADYLHDHSIFRSVDLLPYHTFGKPKYSAFGRQYLWEPHKRLSKSEIEEIQGVWSALGFDVTVGGG
ncbi:MAG: radical SAM protein, partial [Leptolinea sp.]